MAAPNTIGSGSATTGAQGTLPRQGASVNQRYSLVRSNDMAAVIGGGMEVLFGQGVVSGCNLFDNTGLSMKIPSGARFWLAGAAMSLSADQVFNGCADNATNTVWATIARTPASQSLPNASDTWALSVTSNTTDTAPDAWHFRLAKVTTKSGKITAIQNSLAGKFVPVADLLRDGATLIPAGEGAYVPVNRSRVLAGSLVVNGCVAVDGRLRLLGA